MVSSASKNGMVIVSAYLVDVFDISGGRNAPWECLYLNKLTLDKWALHDLPTPTCPK